MDTILQNNINNARLLREIFLRDPHRPGYHFMVPEGVHVPVDPNGAIFWNGRYHLCYIYQHEGNHYWGHISSLDLLHWRHHEPALAPGEGDEGIFSGGAFSDDDKVVFTYWRLGKPDGIAIATSSDPQLDHWKRFPQNPVLPSKGMGWNEITNPNGEIVPVGTADPSAIWKENGRYYMLTGSLPVLQEFGIKRKIKEHLGDTLFLFVSDDLVEWKYLHRFYESRREWTREDEDNMCPDFFPLSDSYEGGKPSGKHMILFISHNLGCQYYIGDYHNLRFSPERHGRMTWTDNTYFAPESLLDGRGRRIMWTWVFDHRTQEEKEKTGWSGELSLPRVLWLGQDGDLRMEPVHELKSLRHNEKSWNHIAIKKDNDFPVDLQGDSLEIEAEFAPGAAREIGLKIRLSPDGSEETRVFYDADGGALVIDASRSSSTSPHKTVERAPFKLNGGEKLCLRIFIDKSIVEVFVNSRQAAFRRIYPSRPDSLGVSLFSHGAAADVLSLRSWEIMPTNPY